MGVFVFRAAVAVGADTQRRPSPRPPRPTPVLIIGPKEVGGGTNRTYNDVSVPVTKMFAGD